jgi:CheY-like chemotaxis protein
MQRSLVARLAQDEPAWRTLIIEDEDVNAQLLQQLLERAGFQVQVAENGKKGIEAFQSWRPHFIWMDWRMPVMDGLEATRRIRALEGGQEVKIAVLSASAFEDEKAQMMAAGADDYVAKPLQLDAIYNCMARLLGISFVAGCSEPTTGAHRGAAIDPVALAALPASAILELKGAVVSLNSARIATAIEQVALSNAPLADTLARHAQQLQYTKILLASQATGDSPIA